MRMNECDFTKRVYESMIEGRGVRGRPPFIYLSISLMPRPLSGTSHKCVATAELSPGLPV